jgi:hypothetical protein
MQRHASCGGLVGERLVLAAYATCADSLTLRTNLNTTDLDNDKCDGVIFSPLSLWEKRQG